MGERLFLRLEEDALHGPESSAPSGTLHAFAIPAPLQRHVSQLLLYRETLPPDVEVLERVIPDGSSRLVLNFGDAPTEGHAPGARALVLGASAAPALVRMQGHIEGFSIALRPGAATALFGIPAGDLAGAAVPLDELWGRAAPELLDRLDAASNLPERAALIRAALLHRLASPPSAHARTAARAATLISASGGRRTLRDLAADLGLGERRLQQLFQLHIGLPPRTWSRLARMHALLRSLRRVDLRVHRPDWARLALDHGYYDQAHLANELRALCGLTPTEYLARTASHSSKTAP